MSAWKNHRDDSQTPPSPEATSRRTLSGPTPIQRSLSAECNSTSRARSSVSRPYLRPGFWTGFVVASLLFSALHAIRFPGPATLNAPGFLDSTRRTFPGLKRIEVVRGGYEAVVTQMASDLTPSASPSPAAVEDAANSASATATPPRGADNLEDKLYTDMHCFAHADEAEL